MTPKRVCVVGAGVSGLVTIKECKSAGLEPVCYELHSDLGGIWTVDRDDVTSNNPRVWDSLISNTTRYIMTFSDFHPQPDTPMYLTRQAIEEYYQSYAQHFRLRDHIRFNTRVVHVRKSPDHERTGRWEVFTCPTTEFRGGNKQAGSPASAAEIEACTIEVFDAVLVCSGFFKIPIYPEIQGLESFSGTVSHSFDYKSSAPYKDKSVLVVGNSFSAGDIANDIACVTGKPVGFSVGRGTWIEPRVMSGGLSPDRTVCRRGMYTFTPEVFNNWIIQECQSRLDHLGNGINPDQPPNKSAFMLGDDIFLKIHTGQIRINDELVALDGSKAKFKDGTECGDLDVVLFATGYKMDASFVDLKIVDDSGVVQLHHMMLPTGEKHHTLGFIGFLNGDGPPAQQSELQARYMARLISGKMAPPSQKLMEENVKTLANMAMDRRGKLSYNLPLFVVGDNIAKELGVYPDYWSLLLRDPVLAYRSWNGPLFSAQYRLLGPGSDWEAASMALYRAHEVMTTVSCSREKVKIVRDDVRAAQRKRMVCLTLSVAAVGILIGYTCVGKSRLSS